MKKGVKDKSLAFAIEVTKMVQSLYDQKHYVLGKQLLKSGTSIGAMIFEAEMAESKKDFIHKMSIALKEAHETIYWLDLLQACHLKINTKILHNNCREILRILISIIKSAKSKADHRLVN